MRKEGICVGCARDFALTEADHSYYQRFEVPPATMCPDCRQQRRIAHANQMYLFRRTCDGTGLPIISNYPPESPFPIYSQNHWYQDEVDNTEFGRDFDFTQSFFAQFWALKLVVPRPALFTDYLRDENCAYTNHAGKNKDCYLIFDSDENRDCLYSYSINQSVNVADCYRGEKLELCYEAVDCRNCYGCGWIYNCDNCKDSFFLANCIGCKNSLFCSNLQHQEYHVYNKRVSPAQFEQLRAQLTDPQQLQELLQNFNRFRLTGPQKYLHGFQNESVTGDYLTNCKNGMHCFDCRDLWDGRYVYQGFMKLQDCMDVNECGQGELLYECLGVGYNAYQLRFSHHSLSQVHNLDYCELCFHGCANLFGCIGLKRKQNCILNKQYSPQDYARIVPRIIDHMRATGEWGEFFPIIHSAYPYNLTLAQTFYPLDKAAAVAAGYSWRDDDLRVEGRGVSEQHLRCSGCRREYKLISQELLFYQRLGVASPALCFFCRHAARFKTRTPRKLWQRQCDQCNQDLTTAYAPARSERVFCDECYLHSLNGETGVTPV